MKKSAILIMLSLTLVFAAFVAGFYVGRNYDKPSVQISGIPTHSASASTPAEATTPLPTSTAPGFPIDINSATLEQFISLPGIGEVLAQRILDYRNEYGPFEKAEDLMNVSGIGEKKLAGIIEYITVGG